jgi:hypothetical protein
MVEMMSEEYRIEEDTLRADREPPRLRARRACFQALDVLPSPRPRKATIQFASTAMRFLKPVSA